MPYIVAQPDIPLGSATVTKYVVLLDFDILIPYISLP
jgi:hypothetical protein